MGSERKSWLDPSAGLAWRGFAAVESAGSKAWAWSLGADCALTAPAAGSVYFSFIAPVAGTAVEINGGRRWVSERPWQELSGKVELGAPGPVRFTVSQWNGGGAGFAAADARPLALNFKTAFFVERAAAPLPVQTKKVCPYPFSKMEVYSPAFAPCCTWWLKDELAFEGNEGDPWNSGAAQALRRSVLNGTYEFCKLDVCQAPLLDRSELERAEEFELPIAPENLAALRLGLTEMPAGPAAVVVLADPRCNLACPSCRQGMITTLTAQESEQLKETERQLEKYRESLRVLVLASNGETFYSPFLREKLKEATRERYPSLEYVEIISNGILFDQKSYDALKPGSALIRKARISIDAGDASTYARVRGGDWERLQKNLRWLSGLRRAGSLDNFRLNFVLSRANYASLPAFFALAASLEVDEVFVSRALPWTGAGFFHSEEDIFKKEHPEHGVFRSLWRDLLKTPPGFRVLGNVADAISSGY